MHWPDKSYSLAVINVNLVEDMMGLPVLYGVPFSQPVRAVVWSMLLKKAPFRFVISMPGSNIKNGSKSPEYLARFPGGTVPCYEEPDTGFSLGESNAIMTYLANSHGWEDLYPGNPKDRALIDSYLHFHHRNVREGSTLVATRVRPDLVFPESTVRLAEKNFRSALGVIENYFLTKNDYLIFDRPTIADISAYAEIGQMQPHYTDVFDLAEFPNVGLWLKRMAELSGYEAAHKSLEVLGSIRDEAPDMDSMKKSTIAGVKAISEAVDSL